MVPRYEPHLSHVLAHRIARDLIMFVFTRPSITEPLCMVSDSSW
jgi:hypothetical protein